MTAPALNQLPGEPEWSDQSLRLLQERLAWPLPPRPVPGPVPAVNPDVLAEELAPLAFTAAQAVQARNAAGVAEALVPLGVLELRALVVILASWARFGPPCRDCGTLRRPRADGGYDGSRGRCRSCYDTAKAAGFPESEPVHTAVKRAERQAEYAWLRGGGVYPEEAAERVRIQSPKTAAAYESAYQAGLAAEREARKEARRALRLTRSAGGEAPAAGEEVAA